MIDVNDLIGKPYKLGGTGPYQYDCWGLVREVYHRLGRDLPGYESATFSRSDIVRVLHGEYQGVAESIKTPEEWDFVADLRRAHIGLYTQGRVLHATATGGVQLTPLDAFRATYTKAEFFRCR